MGKEKVFIYSHSKGNIDYYNVNPKVTVKIKSINLETGEIEKKKITQYTIHKNLEMYKIHDPKKRFEDFWASSDHSLIVYESKTKKYIKISPLKIKENPEKYQLIKDVLYGKMFIPCNEIEITYDPNVTEAGDLTVEDNYTFATHDGIFVQDTVALYRPVTEKAIKETEQKLWTKNNIFSAANMEVQFKAKQGIVYGIYKLTKSKIGRELFKQSLNLDYDITEPVTSKKLSQIIQEECKKGNIDILDKVKLLGFSTTIASPETISILDLEPMDVKLTGDKEKDSEVLSNSLQKLKETFPKKDIIESGARASWDQVKQMVTARGYISDFFGNIINVPIKSCYAKGLSSEDFFISSYGARKGILDVAENTAKSGYLTRKMVYGGISSQLDLNLDDCGTEYCVEVNVYSMDLAKSLLGRYYYENLDSEELKCVENPEDILHKSIFLRTPLLCQSKKICKKCYGKLSEVHKSPFIGVIAAQTLGERSVQLVLRTFHLCIRKNTKILTISNGLLDAEEVYNKVNSCKSIFVLSISPDKKTCEITKIVEAHKTRLVSEAIKVTTKDDRTFTCTLDHKVLTNNGKYKEAQDLELSDKLVIVIPETMSVHDIEIKNIEKIQLDEPEYFYDFTVESQFHNFPVDGIIVHNSGVAQSKKLGKQEDIVSDMENTINSIDRDIPVKDVTEAFEKTLDMWELFKQYGYLHLVHFEVITSQRLWAELDDKFIRYRTNIQNLEKFETYNEDGEIIDTEYTLKMIGVKNIASLESWFLGMIFQNIRQNFIKGVLHESSETSILEKIVMGQII